jgi:WD40 repeat protein
VLAYAVGDRTARVWAVEEPRPAAVTPAKAPAKTKAKAKAKAASPPPPAAPRVTEVAAWPPGAEVTSVALTPDGSRALLGAADGTVRLWQLPP